MKEVFLNNNLWKIIMGTGVEKADGWETLHFLPSEKVQCPSLLSVAEIKHRQKATWGRKCAVFCISTS